MERTYKTWGEKWTLFQNDLCEVSILHLKPNRRCSWHTHQSKFNQFFVIGGKIRIKTEWGTSTVTKGQIFTTKPGEWHEFQTTDNPALIQEIMYVQYSADDIQRKKLGGILDE